MKKLYLAILAIMLLGIAMVSAASFTILGPINGSGNPGEAVSYTIEVQNDDTMNLSFTCTSTTLVNGVGDYEITVPTIDVINDIPQDEIGYSTFEVTVPAVASGLYTGTLTCTESENQTFIDAPISLNVLGMEAFETDSEVSVDIIPSENEDVSIEVTNTGSNTLDFTATFESEDGDDGVIEDNDGDEITITFTSLPTSVLPGETETITMNVDVENGMDHGEQYDGTITITAGSIYVDVALNIDLEAQICDEGLQGDKITLSVDEPDDGDDYKPGETVNVEFDVENEDNDDIDVEVTIILWDDTDGDEVETIDVDELNIDEDEEETFVVEFELPTDLDEDHTYYLYIKVNEDGNEDDQCNYERINLDIERDDDDVAIDSVSVSPSTLSCGDDYVVTVEVLNIGTDEQEDVFIEIVEDELELSVSSDNFDLGDHNDNDNDYKATFSPALPTDLTSGTYYMDVKVYENDGSLFDSELVSISVGSCSSEETSTEEEEESVEGVEIEMLVDNDFDVVGLDKLTIPVIIQNKGDEDTSLTLRVDDISWADVEGTEYLSNINAGQSLHAYVYLNLETDVTGIHDLVIEIEDGQGTKTTETVSLDFGDSNSITGAATGISEWDTTMWFWIIGIILLVVILIILIRILTK